MPLKNPSTNQVQVQTTKALMKKNYNIPKRRTKPLQKHKNDQTIEKMKKGRKTLQNLLQPRITNNPDMSVSIRLDHQTQNRSLHLAFIGLPLTHLPKNHADLQSHLNFNGPAPTHHPKKNADHLQSYSEAGMILRRSQTYSHRNGSKMNSKKRNLDSKPTATARLKTLWIKS